MARPTQSLAVAWTRPELKCGLSCPVRMTTSAESDREEASIWVVNADSGQVA